MVTRAGLYNEVAGVFYRTTEALARARAAGGHQPSARVVRGGTRAPMPTALVTRPADPDDIRAFDPLWDERAEQTRSEAGG
jgi:hypothetical protein